MTAYPMCGGCSVVMRPEMDAYYEGSVACCSVSCSKKVAERDAKAKTATSTPEETMDKLTIVIETGGAAFEPNPEAEVARILHDFADRIGNGGNPAALFDVNGNRAGNVVYGFYDE